MCKRMKVNTPISYRNQHQDLDLSPVDPPTGNQDSSASENDQTVMAGQARTNVSNNTRNVLVIDDEKHAEPPTEAMAGRVVTIDSYVQAENEYRKRIGGFIEQNKLGLSWAKLSQSWVLARAK